MGGDPFQMYAAVKMRDGVRWDILTDEEAKILKARCKGLSSPSPPALSLSQHQALF